jgi:hypothetical protein
VKLALYKKRLCTGITKYKVCTKSFVQNYEPLQEKEEGASCDPLSGSANTIVVYYGLEGPGGAQFLVIWSMDVKSEPGPLVSVRHAAQVPAHPLAAAPISPYAMKFASSDRQHLLCADNRAS